MPATRNPQPATSPATSPQTLSADSATDSLGFPVADPHDDDLADGDFLQLLNESEEEARNVREVAGVELYPEDIGGPDMAAVDPHMPLPEGEPDEDDDVTWVPDKPEPMSRADAMRAFHQALVELSDVAELRDPKDPSGDTVIVTPGEIQDRYPYRSRPWFSDILSEMADGKITPPPARSLGRADDYPPHEGKYRLRRLPDDHGE